MTQIVNKAEGRMWQFQLDGEDDVYAIPLASSLPLPLIRLADKNPGEFAIALFEKYCPELASRDDVMLDTLKAVLEAWDAACKADGADLGKSRASSKR